MIVISSFSPPRGEQPRAQRPRLCRGCFFSVLGCVSPKPSTRMLSLGQGGSSRPPRPLVRATGSPGTNYPFGLPLFKCFKTAGAVLGDVEGDDNMVRDRPRRSGFVRVVDPSETRQSDRSDRDLSALHIVLKDSMDHLCTLVDGTIECWGSEFVRSSMNAADSKLNFESARRRL